MSFSFLMKLPFQSLQLLPQLSVIEAQIATLQQYQVETLTLRSGI